MWKNYLVYNLSSKQERVTASVKPQCGELEGLGILIDRNFADEGIEDTLV